MKYLPDSMGSSREEIAKAYAAGNWFQFPRCFLYAMKGDGAIFLAYLINHAYKVDAETESEGWFKCSASKACEDLVYRDRHVYTIHLRKLRLLGLIRTERRGNPSRQWIRINYDAIRKLVNKGSKNR